MGALVLLVLLATRAGAVATDEVAGQSTAEAEARIEMEDWDGALAILSQVLEASPGDADALNLAG